MFFFNCFNCESVKSRSYFFILFLALSTSFSSMAQKVEPIVQFGHAGRIITEMVYSPDSTILATTDGQFLKLWDMATGLEFQAFTNKTSSLFPISHITFTPNSEQIVYQADGEINFRSIDEGDIVNSFQIEGGATIELEEGEEPSEEDIKNFFNADRYRGVALSQDGTLLATLSESTIEIINLTNDEKIVNINLPQKEGAGLSNLMGFWGTVKGSPLVIAPDNRTFFCNGNLYSVYSGKKQFDFLEGKENFYLNVASYSPDGKTIGLAGSVIDTTGFSSNGNWFSTLDQFSGAQEGTVLFLYDVESGQLIYNKKDSGIFSLSFTKDGSRFITGQYNNLIKVRETVSGKTLLSVKATDDLPQKAEYRFFNLFSKNPAGAVVITPDNEGFITMGDPKKNESLIIWDLKTGEKVRNLGARIPPLNLEGYTSYSDSITLRELEEIQQGFFLPALKYYKGFRVMDLTTGRIPHAYARYDSIVFSPQGNYFLLKSKSGPCVVFESELGEPLAELEDSHPHLSKFIFDTKGQQLAGANGTTFFIWDVKSGKKIWENSTHRQPISFLKFDPSGTRIISSSKTEMNLMVWSIAKKEIIAEIKNKVGRTLNTAKELILTANEVKKSNLLGDLSSLGLKRKNNAEEDILEKAASFSSWINPKGFYDVEFSADGQTMAVWSDNLSSVKFYNIDNPKPLRKYNDLRIMMMQSALLTGMDKRKLASAMDSIKEEETEGTFPFPGSFEEMFLYHFKEKYNLRNQSAISSDFNWFAKAVNKNKKSFIRLTPVRKQKKNKKKIELVESAEYQEGITFSLDSRFVAACSESFNGIRIWSIATGEIYRTLYGHSGKIAFGPNGKTLISSGWDRQVKVWDIEEDKLLYTFIGIKGTNDYIIILPSGYYMTSRRNSRAVAFRKGRSAYPFEQFDLQFQRPDEVLKVFGETINLGMVENPNKSLVEAYHRAFLKRLERMNFKEETLAQDIHLPKIELAPLPLTSVDKKIQLKINAWDEKYSLAVLNVYVNDVPIWGRNGKKLSEKTFDGEVEVTLSNGENKIQATVLNEQQVESMNTTYVIDYIGPPSSKTLHFVTIGSSIFQDTTMNLGYPLKDMEEVKAMFLKKKTADSMKVVFHDLHGTDFTQAGFFSLRDKLKNLKVDDEVIIFIATHGVLDADLNYFLATNDIDFSDPTRNGLPYDALELLLDQIPARNKLVLIDACHAGEIDASEIQFKDTPSIKDANIKFRQFRGTNMKSLGVQNSFDLMKMLFVDLRRSTGATILAAAAGAEVAIESGDWNNSAFVYALKKGLEHGLADFNNDKRVTLSELQDYLTKKVSRLTQGIQQPTFRTQNISNDWQVW